MTSSYQWTRVECLCFIVIIVGALVQLTNGQAVPVFTDPSPGGGSQHAIDESTTIGTSIYLVAATDPDTAGAITYTFEPAQTQFQIVGAEIRTLLAFDYETPPTSYTLVVKATETASAETAFATLTVLINNVNDVVPALTGTFTASVDEEQPVGTVVSSLAFTVTDGDAGDTATYSLTGGSSNFQVDSGTGVVTTVQVIDFEAGVIVFNPVLTVKDSASPTPNSVTQTLTINLTNTNDNTPIFIPAVRTVTIAENTITGTSVVLLTVTDLDVGDTVTVSILSGDDTPNKFQVVGKEIQTTGAAIDYDTLSGANFQYVLTVEGTDGTNTPATATVYVVITGENEATPVWGTYTPAYTDTSTPYSLAENEAIGHTIATIQATDADEGVDGQILYTISSVTKSSTGAVPSGLFHLDSVSGELTTTSNTFDRDTATGGAEYYDLVVMATDQGTTARSVTNTVRVTLSDYNDNTPTFAQNLYSIATSETTVIGTTLLTLVATDDDVTSTLTYTLLTTSTPAAYSTFFEMDTTNTNELKLKTIINLDSPDNHASSYTLYVEVKDGGAPELSSTATVAVTITPNNEATPSFTSATVTVDADEDSAIDTVITTLSAADADYGSDGTLTYTILSGNGDSKFFVDPSSGAMKVLNTLDFETATPNPYVLEVEAKDAGTTSLSGTVTVSITVVDKSDETPTCTDTSVSRNLAEPGTVAAVVYSLTCSDADAIDTLAYSISSGNGDGKFAVTVTGTGADITVAAVVDYDAGPQYYSLVVSVTDSSITIEVPINVAITPVNEITPAFGANLDLTFPENQALSTVLATHTAADADASPHNVVTYEISSVTNSGTSLFGIDATTGEIKLVQSLDYESQISYVIAVIATDGGGLKGTSSVTIQVSDINDVTPSCTPASHVVSVPENTAPVTDIIADFVCVDGDRTVATLTYTITSQTPSAHFEVDVTGTPKLILGAIALDYETESTYEIVLTVSDGTLSTTVNIDISVTDVNDGGPSFSTTPCAATITESDSIGQAVISVPATDPDSSTSTFGNLVYSLISGNSDNKFSINPSTGQISISGVLNADPSATFNLVVQAQEEGLTNSATVTCTITVTGVNDNAPTCTSQAVSVSGAETDAANTVVTTLTCTDADGDTLTYTMATGDTAKFEMNGNALELKAVIDYDIPTTSQYQITITVSDGTNSITVTVDYTVTAVNEHTPALTQTLIDLRTEEDTSPGTLITTVAATDDDRGDTVTYTWVATQTTFTLDTSSGAILLATSLDRELTAADYNLLYVASDGTTPVTGTVTITVTDMNDNTPTFNPTSYSGTPSESSAIVATITTVTATDADDPGTNNYGTVRYSITEGNTGTVFNIDDTTGVITTLAILDYDTTQSYTLAVQAVDSNSAAGALSSTAYVTVNVVAVNEFDPVFAPTTVAVSLNEDTAVGTSVAQVAATDADVGDDGVIFYTMVTHANFYVNTDTGIVYLKASLDYDTTPTTYNLNVVAYDSGTTQKSATAIVVVTVIDVNDNAPTCTNSLQTVSKDENTAVTSAIASFTCSDADATTNAALTYAIVSVNGIGATTPFTIDTTTGAITLAAGLDYESDPTYNILVSVKDTPGLSTTATVNLNVGDVNEATPVFGLTNYAFSIPETDTFGTTVFSVAATDTDSSNTLTYSFNPTSTQFLINPSTGEVTLIQTIDYDALPVADKTITLAVEAVDDGTNPNPLTGTAAIVVTITDANDATPIFLPAVYSASISENDNIGTTVTTVTATDNDDATVTYSLANGFSIFDIDQSGVITITTKGQDYETATQYTVVAYAVDAAAPSNTGSTTINIEVTNYNEHTPVLAPTSSSVSIVENEAHGFQIVDVTATDADAGIDGVITYTISSVPTGYENTFSIDPSTGIMTLAGDLDIEAMTAGTNPMTIVIDATDGGTNPSALMAQFTLTLTVTDYNDVTPSCTKSLYSATVSEDITNTDTVTTLVCTDTDSTAANNVVSYTIISGDTANKFTIPNTGVVTSDGTLDRETPGADVYTLVIHAIDSGSPALTATTTLAITLTDVNDNDPVITASPYTFSQNEDITVGTVVGTVAATDADTGQAGSISFSITSGDVDSNLAIDSNSGEIKLIGALDYENKQQVYTLEFIATDNLATFRTATGAVTINVVDVNDITPTCNPVVTTVEIAENYALTTTFATISCPDSDTTGTDGTVTYTISTVDGVATTSPFSINANTGEVQLSAPLDYETDASKTVVILAIDGGAPALTGTATLNVVVTDINEGTPTFTGTPYTATVAETANVGDSLYAVAVTDTDTADTITYSLFATSTFFSIHSTTGQIDLISALDFESALQTHQITVVATDSGTNPSDLSATVTVTVSVTDANDVSPVFNPSFYTGSIAENDATGTTVTTVTATDTDSGTPTYTIVASSNTDGVFRIETSGVIVIDSTTNLDYDSNTKSYSLVVTADDGTNTATTTVAVVVTNYNDNTPNYASTSSTQTLAENSAIGDAIVTVAATDADHGDDGVITYSITLGNADGRFAIDPSTGAVTLVGSLDMETTETYTVYIDATDGGTSPSALSAQYVLTVSVTDVNDVTPVCTSSLYTTTVLESTATTTSVYQLVCSDTDKSAPNNAVSAYNFVTAPTGGDFSISNSGEVTVTNALDRERTASYSLVIQAIDGGTAPLTTTTTLSITISDVNDETPTYATNPYQVTQGEETAIGTVITTVVATDGDTGDAGTITYAITLGNTEGKFEIDSSLGEIKLVADLDFDSATKTYVLEVEANDNDATTKLTGTTTVSVSVTDANDNTPACNPALQTVEFAEDTGASITIASLTCTDADTTPNSDLTYTIVEVNSIATTTPFSVDNAGVITTATGSATPFDFETTPSYSVLIRVNDGGTTSLSYTASVTIVITDINEHDPSFQNTPYTSNVIEATAVGTSILVVTASDSDTSNTVSYTINPSNTYFEIDSSTGIIYTIAAIDYDTLVSTTITLSVVATDSGVPAKSATETVTMSITNTNDGIPIFNPAVYAVTLSEDQVNGYTVTTLTVTDIDDTTHTLSFASGNDDNVFSVDDAGVLTIGDATNLNYDSVVQSYVLVVHAVDTAGANTGSTTVNIEVTGINDKAPILTSTSSTVNLPENSASGASVVDIVANDADSGTDGDITYAITSVDNSGDGKFSINPTSGRVSVSGDIDRESVITYTVVIRATDAGTNPSSLSDTYTLTVTITDENDNTPQCDSSLYTASLAENTVAATSVSKVTCTDADAMAPSNTLSTYAITSGITVGTPEFAISNTGEITTVTVPDRETVDNYRLVIEVADSGTTPLTATTTLTITITDVNDNTPVFATDPYNFNTDESSAIGTTFDISATDTDIDNAGLLTYSINSGDDDSKFEIDSSTGKLTLIASLDFETATNNPYTLVIHAVDNLATQLTGSTTVIFTVNDVNDNTPVCSPQLNSINQDENTITTTVLFTLTCTDADALTNAALSYTLTTVNGVNPTTTMFAVDTSGAIRLTNLMDYETTPKHTILIEVYDGGAPSLTTTATVEVVVGNVNDNTPAFSSTPYSANVIENTATGTTVFTVAASDTDVVDTVTFSILPVVSQFSIDPATGAIILMQTLDYDAGLAGQSYELIVYATDDGTNPSALSASTTVTIAVTNFNDGTPEFDPGVYTISVSEDAATLVTLTTVTVTDIDDTTFTYTIQSGNTGNVFGLTGTTTTAEITIADNTNLDFETTPTYTLEIKAEDPNGKTGTATVEIQVTGINDNAPSLTSTGSTETVAENVATGTTVKDIGALASDADSGDDGVLSYSIVSGAAGKFAISPTTGIVTVSGSLDMETTQSYTLVVDCVDGGTNPNPRTAQFTLIVTVTDVNDFGPSCSSSLYSASLAEGLGTGQTVSQLTCPDADRDAPNNVVATYAITAGQANGEFLISSTGAVTTAAFTFDRETTDSYELTIVVTDSGTTPVAMSTTTTLTITITDVNDNTPTFGLSVYTINIDESEAIFTSIGAVAATDADIDLAGSFVYSIFSGNAAGQFAIDRTTGDITVAATLDYETTTTTPYELVVYAIDKEATFQTGSTTVSITLKDVNDNQPLCTQSLYTGTVAEGSAASTAVATVACTDADAINTVTYSITTTQTEFSVDTASGVVSTATVPDAETATSYSITVQATDGTFTTDVTVTISITDQNDETPVFNPAGPFSITINEEEAIGYTVFTFMATDADVTSTSFIYSITGGNTAGKFKIGTSTGILQLQSTIDRDNPLTVSYTLDIEVADGVGTNTATSSIVVTIDDINDNYPSCDASEYSITVAEDTTVTTTLLSPVCSDLDVAASPTLLFTIATGNADGKFQMNSGTGVIQLLALVDYDSGTTSYTLTATVDDQAGKTSTITITAYVDPVNQATPVFTGTPFDTTILESEVFGYSVVIIAATDADSGSTHGDVRYSITSGNDAGHFAIDSTTGQITVSGPLDRETTSSYSLTVSAADMIEGDAAALTAQNTFAITLSDVNDNYPLINPSSYTFELDENAAVGSSIVTILATDTDDANAGTAGLQYSIYDGNTLNAFTMTGSEVQLAATVDANTQSVYILKVRVQDQGTPVLSSNTIVSVKVAAINEFAPTFTTTDTTISLSETTALGTSIYLAGGSDSDTGDYGVLRYYLNSGVTTATPEFTVDLFDGTVRVANNLDFDMIPQYILMVHIEDTATSGTNTRTGTMTLTIDLSDENDETPIFTLNTYTATLDENVATSTSVTTVIATDADTGTNAVITYSIVSGTGQILFSVDATSGQVSTAGTIDYETLSVYDLKVQAADGGTPSLSSTCLVRITLTDLNDNTPTFLVSDIAISITEATAINTVIATAGATDTDSLTTNNNVITYSFSVASAKFAIDATSGAITTTDTLDRDTVPSYTLTVLATDGGAGPNIGTATYTIVLTDVNDNDPAVINTPYDTTISEDTVINTNVFDIDATDSDENENAVLTYAITNGDTSSHFMIDGGSGLIQLRSTIDRETIDKYDLEVTITDNGTPAKSAVMTATVTVSDINDNAPVFSAASYSFNVSENVASGTSVDTVVATDQDIGTNGAITFAVASFTTGDSTHFSLDGATGIITTAGTLDRETQDTYLFTVRALDGGANTLTSTVTVTITITDFNDNTPAFSQTLYTATTVENLPATTSILTVVITDIDIGVNNAITLTIDTSTTAGSRANDYITPDSSTFILSVKSPIDRETDTSFNFVLIATDNGTPPLSFSTSVEITIGDENDNAPVFSPTFYNSEIAYNDGCQVTATTLTATDVDEGVNAVISYSTTLNNNPHLFALDSSTGAVTLVATAGITGYQLYAAAIDAGSPSLSSSTGATIRVDTYDPTAVILTYYMDISSATYLAAEATFLSQLTTVYQQTYATSEAKRWCVTAVTSTSCKVHVYVIKDDTADTVGEIDNTKLFLTINEAYAITAADDAGTPAAVISGISWTSFAITRVEKYYEEPPAEDTPWIQTAAGIIIVSIVSSVAFIAIVLIIAATVYACRSPSTGRNRVEVGDDDGGDRVPKNQYHAKNNSMHQKMFKGDPDISGYKTYDKSHPPPAVVALPMPTATKRVPMQVGNKSIEKPKNINIDNGPTLVKQPEKLRAGSPVPTESVYAPQRLPPVRKPPASRPPRSPASLMLDQTDKSVGPQGPGDEANYTVINREFDGRAIDPVSGRLYEYNTRTNERRWVKTPEGQEVKLLTREDH